MKNKSDQQNIDENDELKISFGKVMAGVVFVFCLMLLIYFSGVNSPSLSLFWLVLYFSVVVFILSFRKSFFLYKYKNLVIVFTLLVFIHLIVFPCIYLNFLSKEPNSFEFDSYIAKSEKEISLNKIVEFYSPDELLSKINLIDSVLIDDFGSLDVKLKQLISRDIVATNKYSFFVDLDTSYETLGPGREPEINLSFDFIICDSNGKYIDEIERDFSNSLSGDNSIKSFLNLRKDKYLYSFNNYIKVRKRIEQNDIYWTYDNLLPYSVNIFNTSNINPKTRIANYTVGFHKFLLVILGIFFGILFAKK